MMTGITRDRTFHGNPGQRLTLPAGLRVRLQPAYNLPAESRVKYWALPLAGYPWPADTARWAEGPGVGLYATDVETFETVSKGDKMTDNETAKRLAMKAYSTAPIRLCCSYCKVEWCSQYVSLTLAISEAMKLEWAIDDDGRAVCTTCPTCTPYTPPPAASE